MRFAVNVSLLFADLPLLQRPRAVADAGFEAVEMWWPFRDAVPADRDVDALAAAIEDAGVTLALLNLFGGDLSSGERGVLSHPGREAEFAGNLDVAVGLAGRLGCGVLHALYGNRLDGLDPSAQDEVAVTRFATAASAAARAGAGVVVEALNPVEQPGFPLHRTRDTVALADRVRAETGAEIGVLYDAYHMQRSEGELIPTIRTYAHRFRHVQVADAPDRTAPGTGEIAYPRVLAALEAAGYRGWVGLEYRPGGEGVDDFAWIGALHGALDGRRPGPGGGG